jgi:hypothetical protein
MKLLMLSVAMTCQAFAMCAPSSLGSEKWSILLLAEAVDYNEQTREIDAHGDVHIEPYRSQSQRRRFTAASLSVLNSRGIATTETARGRKWSAVQVSRTLAGSTRTKMMAGRNSSNIVVLRILPIA